MWLFMCVLCLTVRKLSLVTPSACLSQVIQLMVPDVTDAPLCPSCIQVLMHGKAIYCTMHKCDLHRPYPVLNGPLLLVVQGDNKGFLVCKKKMVTSAELLCRYTPPAFRQVCSSASPVAALAAAFETYHLMSQKFFTHLYQMSGAISRRLSLDFWMPTRKVIRKYMTCAEQRTSRL